MKVQWDELLDDYEEKCKENYNQYQPDSTSMKILKESKRIKKSIEGICDTSSMDGMTLYKFSSYKFNTLLKQKVNIKYTYSTKL